MGDPKQISFTLEATVHDQEITPATIGFSLFNQFNGEVESFLTGSQRRAPLEDVRFEIQPGSYRLRLTLPAPLLAAVELDLRKMRQEDALGDIDPKRAEIVKLWQKRARTMPAYRVAIDSLAQTFKPVRITQETDYHTPDEDDWVAVEKYVVGRVVDMGGTTAAKVHVLNDDTSKRLVAASSEAFLRDQKENYLYQKVQVHVAAQENVKTGELRDIRLITFVGKEPSYDEAELEAAIRKGTPAWRSVPDSVAWVRSLRESGDE